MTFTSSTFLPLLAVSLCLYYVFARNKSIQNLLLIAASLVFYGYGHIHYLGILGGISLFTFCMGIFIQQVKHKIVPIIGISVIVLFFVLIKYSGMFYDLFHFTQPSELSNLNLLLPVGLSFYSFTSIGYLADVYSKRIQACNNPLQFFAYSTFFPQLLSGPICFADKQLPQFNTNRKFNLENIKEAIPYLVWGLFKKVVIANTLQKPISYIFSTQSEANHTTLIIGLVIYSIQIYADFSGYSDMAYGIGRLFGIQLPINFNMPYFANNIADYWKKWHSSLSTWFGRYIYIPLGGNRVNLFIQVKNVLIIFLVSGLWHGADLKFVLWGLLNGLFYAAYLIQKEVSIKTKLASGLHFVKSNLIISGPLFTFILVCLFRVYFRADSIQNANEYLQHLFTNSTMAIPPFGLKYLLIASLFIGFEWLQRNQPYPLTNQFSTKSIQWAYYILAIGFITYGFQQPQTTEHIYFKF
ncbi:MAG TPA: MBOAT family O-acyltransferase [Chitinophagaceae bacterium]|nr:MBOAT family O-acyltransferase [Chitinophagaceae bacterium]